MQGNEVKENEDQRARNERQCVDMWENERDIENMKKKRIGKKELRQKKGK